MHLQDGSPGGSAGFNVIVMSLHTEPAKAGALAPFTINVEESYSIWDLKVKIQGIRNIPADQQRLICDGCDLMDELTLSDLGIASQSTLHCVRDLRGGAPGGDPVRDRKLAVENMLRTLKVGRGHTVESADLAVQLEARRPQRTGNFANWYESVAGETTQIMDTIDSDTLRSGLAKILKRYSDACEKCKEKDFDRL